jgi:hypothetical protein
MAFVIYILLYTPVRAIAAGWVFQRLWAWFAVPTFDVVPLNLAQALGVALLVEYLVARTPTRKEAEEADFLKDWLWSATYFLSHAMLTLAIASVVRGFMP